MVSTGFPSVDEYAHGLHEGSLIILGARPGVGKTCVALAIAKNVAAHGPVFFFSMEMRAAELMERLYASVACVSLTHIRERNLSSTEKSFLYTAKEEVDSLDLQFFDDPSTTLLSLKGKVRQLSKEKKPKLIVVDYLQLMYLGSKAESRREEVSAMSRQLKQLAMEIGVPVLALSQLNRVSTFEGGKVDISQLKESGSLEQDADQVWLLDWPTKQEFGGSQSMILKVAKNRNGPIGDVDLIWVPAYQRVEN
jgi:replicative DNA helicase